MPNKVAESLGSRVIFWCIFLSARAATSRRKLTTAWVGFDWRCRQPLSYPEHGHAAPEAVLPDQADRLVVVVGQLDGHHQPKSFSRISPSCPS